jgi:hypothetical protein
MEKWWRNGDEKWGQPDLPYFLIACTKKRAWSDAPEFRVRSNQTQFEWRCEYKDGIRRITDLRQTSAL